jgi:hypothetical protein
MESQLSVKTCNYFKTQEQILDSSHNGRGIGMYTKTLNSQNSTAKHSRGLKRDTPLSTPREDFMIGYPASKYLEIS